MTNEENLQSIPTVIDDKIAYYNDELPKSLGIEVCDVGRVIYPTGVEYVDHSLTMSTAFCFHQCEYCYLAACNSRFRKHDFTAPKVVSNFISKLDADLKVRRKNKLSSVMLSFAGEPLPYGDSPQHKYFQGLTLEALKKLNQKNVSGVVLTKGLLPLELAKIAPVDLAKHNWYGITLVNLRNDKEYREQYEPKASPLGDRLDSLKALKEANPEAKFFISMEPYPTPFMINGMDEAAMKEELEYILSQLEGYVDLVIFGRGNGTNAKGVSLFTKYKDHRNYYLRMAKVVQDWGADNGVQVYVKRKVYGIGKCDKDGNKLPKVNLFV